MATSERVNLFFFNFIKVLLQGWRLTESNLQDFLESIRQQLEKLEDIVAEVSAIANDQLDAIRVFILYY